MAVNKTDLYDPLWTYYCANTFGMDENVNFYISNGYEWIDGISTSDSTGWGRDVWIEEVFNDIDPLIDLDFNRVYSKSEADIVIYRVSSYTSINNNPSILGTTSFNSDSQLQIIWKDQSFNIDRNPWLIEDKYSILGFDEAYTIVHEIGHTLALKHPKEDPYGSWHNSTDTVMSYNVSPYYHGYSGNGFADPVKFSTADIEALQYIWGIEDGKDSNINHSETYKFDYINGWKFGHTTNAKEIVNKWFGTNKKQLEQQVDVYNSYLEIEASSWSGKIEISRVVKAVPSSWGFIQAKQSHALNDRSLSPWIGSVLVGGNNVDILRGLAGFDVLDGGDGDDLIHGGNGRDIITGGEGKDELHGDFGWNTYTSCEDDFIDLIAIKSDQYLENWWQEGKAGNNPNGEKVDIIEGLDHNDQIKIIGVFSSEITVESNSSAHGLNGIGIYANDYLEALYIGGKLSADQIKSITTGDGSQMAMNNKVWSYWSSNTPPPLLS